MHSTLRTYLGPSIALLSIASLKKQFVPIKASKEAQHRVGEVDVNSSKIGLHLLKPLAS